MPSIKKLAPDQVAGAREYARIEKRRPRIGYQEHLRQFTILFSTGLSHFELLKRGNFSQHSH